MEDRQKVRSIWPQATPPTSLDAPATLKQRARNKRRKTKRFYLVTLTALFFCVAGSVLSVIGYQTYSADYHEDMALAQGAAQHLQAAETLIAALPQHPFDVNAVNQTRHEFAAAVTNFSQLNDNLRSLPGMATFIPVYGARLHAALHLVPLAIDVSQAGIASCDILQVLILKFHDPLKTQGLSLTMADITSLDQDFHLASVAINGAIAEARQLQLTDVHFDPRIAKAFDSFQRHVPALQTWLADAERILPVLPTLLGIGTPTNYLIEILDTTELRPAGGFIGNYGIATLSGGRLTTAHITDVDLLDGPFYAAGKRIPYPEAYQWFRYYLASESWSLRDSNLDADFPTAARYAELNYARERGKVPVQGVIAITPTMIQHALEITGPISIPEYHETVTAQNLIDRIHYHQLAAAAYEGADTVLAPDGHSSLRKHFTAILAEHFMDRVRHLSASALPKFLQVLVNSVLSKDIQLYFNRSTAEDLLQRYHLDAAIQSPASDSLFVVDANVSANKANYFILNTLKDQVMLDGAGNAIHHTTLTYAWTVRGQIYGNPVYKDYVRVYVPSDSVLQSQNGWKLIGTSQAFGHKVWVGDFSLRYGQTRTITLLWTEPGGAKKDANGWHYRYLIQRQAGALRTLNLQILLPSCATGTKLQGGLIASTRQSATLTESLNEDSSFGVDYAC